MDKDTVIDCVEDNHFADWANYDELYIDDEGMIRQVADCQCSKKIYERLFECIDEYEVIEQ